MITIRVRWDPSLLRPNRTVKMRRGHKGRLIRESQEAARVGWLDAGQPRAAGPVRYYVIVRRARRIDDDAVHAALKWARDVLFGGAVTPDDSPAWVQIGGPVEWEIAREWRGREEVLFVIEECDAT